MKKKIAIFACFASTLCPVLFIISYFSFRSIGQDSITIKVNYSFTSSYREYIRDVPDADEKLNSGTYDPSGTRSLLLRLYRPIEEWEMNSRFNLRH